MKHWKKAIVSLVVLALLALPLLGCAEDKEEEKVTIKVGVITDLTGAASSACVPLTWAVQDALKYLQQEDPIPGVELKLDIYDARLDPARAIPGYEWLKGRGAVVILGYLPQINEILGPFLQRDKMPVFCTTLSEAMKAYPWIFGSGLPTADQHTIPLKWLSDHWPNYPTKPKIGVVGWDTSYERDIFPAIKDYCLAHPDDFEYVGTCLAPVGVMTWSGEVEKLKDCDYITPCHAGGTGQATFIAEFRARGYEAKFFSGEAMPCWINLIVGRVSWEGVDGSLSCLGWAWFTAPYPVAGVAKELLHQNHPGESEHDVGYAYSSEIGNQFFFYHVMKAAIEEVGAENLDGQAIYDTAIKFRYTLEGFPEMGYTETERVNHHHGTIYEWKAEASDLMLISDWLPVPD